MAVIAFSFEFCFIVTDAETVSRTNTVTRERRGTGSNTMAQTNIGAFFSKRLVVSTSAVTVACANAFVAFFCWIAGSHTVSGTDKLTVSS